MESDTAEQTEVYKCLKYLHSFIILSFQNWCVILQLLHSSLGLVTFQVVSSHMWVMAVVLESVGIHRKI